ncbi:hypothetical protein NPIL_437561, partial [Nephila pilipes]
FELFIPTRDVKRDEERERRERGSFESFVQVMSDSVTTCVKTQITETGAEDSGGD